MFKSAKKNWLSSKIKYYTQFTKIANLCKKILTLENSPATCIIMSPTTCTSRIVDFCKLKMIQYVLVAAHTFKLPILYILCIEKKITPTEY